MNFPLKIGSRASRLALAQVEEALNLLHLHRETSLPYKLIPFATAGDKDKLTPLTENVADDFFTDALDAALIQGKIDVAIHSAKDLPQHLAPGLEIFALTAGLDNTDAWVSPCHWKDLPAGARVGTSSALRQKQIQQMRPDLRLVEVRGTIDERIALVKNKKIDGVIIAACALKRLKLEGEIRDIFPWEGMPLQGQLALVGRAQDAHLKRIFEPIDVRRQYATVTLVGAGPGDPDLITMKGIKALRACDCVFYDYLVDVSLLNHAPQAEHIFAGKRKGDHTLKQGDLSRMLKEKAMHGKRVVRLKGGDPFIFARGADEIIYLQSYHIDVRVIPGISSAMGIPSSLGIPLTARGIASSVAFVSGHDEGEDHQHAKPIAIPTADTVVFLMGLTKLKAIVTSLKEAGRTDHFPIIIISKGTRVDEQIVSGTLGDIEFRAQHAGLNPPALIIAGETVRLFKGHPAKKVFLHCGTHPHFYRDLGTIVPWPMIEIKPVIFNAQEQRQLAAAFDGSDVVVLTSVNAVRHFLKTILELRPAQAVIAKIFVVIGQATAQALAEFHCTAQIVSSQETAEGLFKTMHAVMDLKGKNILLPRSSLPNPYLKQALSQQGAKVQEWAVYENTKPPKKDLPSELIHGVIFTSPSTVKNFLADYGTIPPYWKIIAKGPVTALELEKLGYKHVCHCEDTARSNL